MRQVSQVSKRDLRRHTRITDDPFEQRTREGKSHLIFGYFSLTPWTMPTTGLAAKTPLQMIRLGKNQIRPIHVVIHPLIQGLARIRLWKAAAHI